MMKKQTAVAVALSTLLLAGCNTIKQQPLSLDTSYYENKEKVVGVYFDPLPQPDTHIYGASCLLCYGVAVAANSSLTTHIKTLDTGDLEAMEQEVLASLNKRGINAIEVEGPLKIGELKDVDKEKVNFAKKDFTALKSKLNVDELLVIDLNRLGAYRTYSSYTPTSDPKGNVAGIVYTVDLTTNAYKLYKPLDQQIDVAGVWDEPPSFPGVTSSYYEAIERTKEVVNNLFN